MRNLLCHASIVIAVALPTSASTPRLNVAADPRIELLAAVQLLSDYGERTGLITRYDFPYKYDALAYFEPYKDHEAVRLFAEMSEQGFSYDAPPAAMLYLSDPPELENQLPFSGYLAGRAGGEERLSDFVAALRDFSRASKFTDFFRAHEGTYRELAKDVRSKMADADYIDTLESYYGMRQHSYNILLAPLFHHGGFGPRVERDDGKSNLYNIVGPIGVENGLPIFGSTENFRHTAWHEFSHSFVNPTTESFNDQISRYEALFEPLRSEMEKQAYSDWQTCVNEHIVRAVTSRLTARELGDERGASSLQNEKRRGFFYVEALSERLEQYERERDAYPTLVDFYPELIAVFRTLSESDLGEEFYTVPYTGTINDAFGGPAVLVVSTAESDADAQTRLQDYVKSVRDQLFEGAEILTDREALEKDLSARTVVAYGTPQGNLWIARVMAGVPVKIESDRIVADSVHMGRALRFITAWPNPQNPVKAVVIYTAQRVEDIVGINSVFHGPTDFVVAKGTEVLQAADYQKSDGTWGLNAE